MNILGIMERQFGVVGILLRVNALALGHVTVIQKVQFKLISPTDIMDIFNENASMWMAQGHINVSWSWWLSVVISIFCVEKRIWSVQVAYLSISIVLPGYIWQQNAVQIP